MTAPFPNYAKRWTTQERKAFTAEKTLHGISTELGRTYHSVYKFARENQLPFRALRKRINAQVRDEVVRMCRTRSPTYVAMQVGISYKSVLNIRREATKAGEK